jgi:hypothetical protein
MGMLPSFIAGSALGTTVFAPIAEVIGYAIGEAQAILAEGDFTLSMYINSLETTTLYAAAGKSVLRVGGAAVSAFG